MNVKLSQSIAGTRFSFVPRQIVRCSDTTGARLVEHGIGVKVADAAEVDGELQDVDPDDQVTPPARRGGAERADRIAPEAAVTQAAPEHCEGTTTRGNPCLRAPAAGSKFCDKHQE